MKNILTAFFLFVILASCKNKNESTDTSKQNKLQEFGENYNASWNSQNPNNVASFFAEDGVLIVNKGIPIIGRKDITIFAGDFMTAFPDMKLLMDSLVSKGERTEFYWTFIGTNTGLNGTGNTVNFSGFESWIINSEGFIQESIGTFDSEDYNKQISKNVEN